MTDGGGWYTDNLSSDKNRKNVVFGLNQGDSPVPTIDSGGLQWTDARGGLQHGGGQRTRLNFASTRAGGESAFVAVLVPGARIGDAVVVTPPPACIERGGFYTGHVHDNSGNVWLKFHNDTAASINPPSGEFVIATL